MADRILKAWRGDASGGGFVEYRIETSSGMVVLDLILKAQAEVAPDLACRWNCKAGKCGSCSMEINGKPKLACMTRLSDYPEGQTLTVQPLKAFPVIRDLVTDVRWNYEQKKRITPFTPPRRPEGDHRMMQVDVDRIQEFRKCIECFLCQDVCHVLRDHHKSDRFVGPRFMIHLAQLEMHPLDTVDRIERVRDDYGSGFCNITRCCTEVCPEHIQITDNGIIPLKERVVSRFYDPIAIVMRKVFGTDNRRLDTGA